MDTGRSSFSQLRRDICSRSAHADRVENRPAGEHSGMLVVTVTESSGVSTVLRVAGVLDTHGAERLLSRLDRLLDQGYRSVVLDLTDVEFCDSSGVSALVRGHARATAAAGRLRIAAASDQVRSVLELSGLNRMFGLKSTMDTATS